MGAFSYLLLASGSPRRSFLLGEMGVHFETMPAPVEEAEDPDMKPDVLVLGNAQLKADWVAQKRPDALVLGSDTTVALSDRVLNKPADWDEARSMLRALSGQTHVVYTAVCLMHRDSGFSENHFETSQVTFKELDDATIEEYFSIVNPLDKAGAYGIQEGSEMIISELEGSLNNVMGLPTEFLEQWLKKLGFWEELTKAKL